MINEHFCYELLSFILGLKFYLVAVAHLGIIKSCALRGAWLRPEPCKRDKELLLEILKFAKLKFLT